MQILFEHLTLNPLLTMRPPAIVQQPSAPIRGISPYSFASKVYAEPLRKSSVQRTRTTDERIAVKPTAASLARSR